MAALKAWPVDALMIVCASKGEAIHSQMQTVRAAICRDCGAAVEVDGASIDRALIHPHRLGRPVEFFCIPCCVQYDPRSLQLLEDRRPHPSSSSAPNL